MGISLFIQSIINGLLIGGVYSLVAMGLTLIFGTMNICNFAHGEFIMVGMYITFFLHAFTHLDPVILLIPTAIISFIIGVIIYKILISRVIHLAHETQMILTLGLSVVLLNGVLILFGSEHKTVHTAYSLSSVPIGSLNISAPRLIAFIISCVIAGLLWWFLKSTDIGKALRATSEKPEIAILLGISVKRMRIISFGIGTALAGIAGALLTSFFMVFPNVGQYFVLLAFVVVVLGGMGNILGAMVGSVIIGIAEALVGQYVHLDLSLVAVFIIFIFVLIFKPQGIIGGGRSY